MLNLPPSAFPASLRALLVPPPSTTDPVDGRQSTSPRHRHRLRVLIRRQAARYEPARGREEGEVVEASD